MSRQAAVLSGGVCPAYVGDLVAPIRGWAGQASLGVPKEVNVPICPMHVTATFNLFERRCPSAIGTGFVQ